MVFIVILQGTVKLECHKNAIIKLNVKTISYLVKILFQS